MRGWWIAFVACGCALGCSSPAPSPVIGITISTGDLVPPFSTNVLEYEVTSLTTMVPVSITVTGQDVTINGTPARNGVPQDVSIPSLDDASSILVAAKDTKGAPITYTIHTVPQVRPRYTVTTNASPVKGQILLTPFQLQGTNLGGPTFLYILDETGRLLFYRQTLQATSDFERVTLPNGTVRYTYVMQDQPINWATFPLEPCTAYVLDDHFRQLQTIRLAPSGARPVLPLDEHQFTLLDDDHWIALGYLGETVTNVPGYATSNVVATVVQEVKAGNVLFDWDSTSAPALYTESVDGNDFTNAKTPYADYNHLNAVDIDPDNGNLVASLRHDDAIIELDRGTGTIAWTFGGTGDQFGLAATDKFSHQHHITFLGSGHLLLFDNGNASQLSKVREFQIDVVNHTAQSLAAISIDNHYTQAMGSAQKIDGHYFIGWGYRQATESDVTEIDATTQQKSFELSFQDGYISYRALKFR